MSAKGSNFKEDDSPLPSRSYCSTYVVNSCTFKHVEVPLDVGAVALDGLQDGLHPILIKELFLSIKHLISLT